MQDTKEYILRIAFGLFLQKSFKEVTMKDIVDKTGLSKGAFYHYFESKEQLFQEIIDMFLFTIMKKGFSNLPENSFEGFYKGYLHTVSTTIKEMRADEKYLNDGDPSAGYNFYNLINDAIKLFPQMKTKIVEMESFELQNWTNAVSDARKRGEIRSAMMDEQIAKIFIYTNDGVGMRLLMEGKADALEPELLKLWNAFYTDLKA